MANAVSVPSPRADGKEEKGNGGRGDWKEEKTCKNPHSAYTVYKRPSSLPGLVASSSTTVKPSNTTCYGLLLSLSSTKILPHSCDIWVDPDKKPRVYLEF